MYTRRCLLIAVSAGLLAAQDSAQEVQVAGDVKTPLTLIAGDLAKMPRATVKMANIVYEGVWVHEVLKRAGVPQGEALRGKALSTYVLASAQDGYQVAFSLGELDPSFADNQILLADTANGKALSGDQGRFRLVVPKDIPAARSVRMLTKIEVIQTRK